MPRNARVLNEAKFDKGKTRVGNKPDAYCESETQYLSAFSFCQHQFP
jgi:hypothetical protein